jgi:hypothetical protein
MLKNIAEEIAGTTLGINWVSRFRKRHNDRLSSLYLRTIDHQRKTADNSRYFQRFFTLVRLLFIAFLPYIQATIRVQTLVGS